MSENYNDYLKAHISNVQTPELSTGLDVSKLTTNLCQHDNSKFSTEEYEPYDIYFYGNARILDKIKKVLDKEKEEV